MKNSFGYLAVVLILFSGCYRAKPRVPETTFFRDFSLASVIERMHIAELKFQSGSEGSSEAFGNSSVT